MRLSRDGQVLCSPVWLTRLTGDYTGKDAQVTAPFLTSFLYYHFFRILTRALSSLSVCHVFLTSPFLLPSYRVVSLHMCPFPFHPFLYFSSVYFFPVHFLALFTGDITTPTHPPVVFQPSLHCSTISDIHLLSRTFSNSTSYSISSLPPQCNDQKFLILENRKLIPRATRCSTRGTNGGTKYKTFNKCAKRFTIREGVTIV